MESYTCYLHVALLTRKKVESCSEPTPSPAGSNGEMQQDNIHDHSKEAANAKKYSVSHILPHLGIEDMRYQVSTYKCPDHGDTLHAAQNLPMFSTMPCWQRHQSRHKEK